MFDKILNWRLLSGSHDFPGPDGGTCINEAAVVAAGLEYRSIKSYADCPPCFSPVIASYTIRLNDSMPDDLRQELLMPFVTRLAGTADNANEIKRAQHIAFETIRRILPIALRAAKLEQHATACEAAKDWTAAVVAANAADVAANTAIAAYAYADAADVAAYSAYAANAAYFAADAANAANFAADAADVAANTANAVACPAVKRQIFTVATAILNEAIHLGKQCDPLDVRLVVARMDAAKAKRRELCGND